MTIKMYFGIIARKKRKEFGLSQEKVAEYAGMTTQMYREIEKGKRSTAWEKWLIICAVLRIGVEDMLRLQECLLAEDEGKAELMKWLKAKQASETAESKAPFKKLCCMQEACGTQQRPWHACVGKA